MSKDEFSSSIYDQLNDSESRYIADLVSEASEEIELFCNSIDDFELPSDDTFDDQDDKRSLEEIIVSPDDLGNTSNKQALMDEACRRIALTKDLPFVAELFGTPEKREQFVKEMLQDLPPPTSLQKEIIAATFEAGVDTPPIIDNIEQAARYIESKAAHYKPDEDLLERAKNLATYKKVRIPRVAMFNAKAMRSWIKETESV